MIKIYKGKQANSPKLFGLTVSIILSVLFLLIAGIIYPSVLNGMKDDGLDGIELFASSIAYFGAPILFSLVIGIAAFTANSSNKKEINFYGMDGFIYFEDGISTFRFHKEDIISTKNIDFMRLVGKTEIFVKIKHFEYKSFKTGEFVEENKKIKLYVASGLKNKDKKEIIEKMYDAERKSLKLKGVD